MAVKGFENLIVWQRAMELMKESYGAAAKLPLGERHGLVDQMRRSALSVPANIAEGHGRGHLGDYLHHLSIASGSLAELRTLLLAAECLGYIPHRQLARPLALAEETARMLLSLRRSAPAVR